MTETEIELTTQRVLLSNMLNEWESLQKKVSLKLEEVERLERRVRYEREKTTSN